MIVFLEILGEWKVIDSRDFAGDEINEREQEDRLSDNVLPTDLGLANRADPAAIETEAAIVVEKSQRQRHNAKIILSVTKLEKESEYNTGGIAKKCGRDCRISARKLQSAAVKEKSFDMEKNNGSIKKTAIGFLTGVVIGAGGFWGVQKFTGSRQAQKDNFELIAADPSGDCVITRHGKRFHRPYCSSLRKAKETETVSSTDAQQAGLKPCSRCWR